jgi:hypothetical protein
MIPSDTHTHREERNSKIDKTSVELIVGERNKPGTSDLEMEKKEIVSSRHALEYAANPGMRYGHALVNHAF